MTDAPFILRHGDGVGLLRSLPEGSIDCLITDPPYSSGGLHASARRRDPRDKYANDGKRDGFAPFAGEFRDQRSWGFWCTEWLSHAARALRPGGVAAVFTDWRQLPTLTDALQASGLAWRGVVVWDKTEACRPQKGRFRQQCEFVVWGSKGAMPTGGPCLPGQFRQIVPRGRSHLTEKPLALMRELVKICPEGGKILDPFMGAGTTGAAALLEGRRFEGVEIERSYYEIACQRIRDAHRERAA